MKTGLGKALQQIPQQQWDDPLGDGTAKEQSDWERQQQDLAYPVEDPLASAAGATPQWSSEGHKTECPFSVQLYRQDDVLIGVQNRDWIIILEDESDLTAAKYGRLFLILF